MVVVELTLADRWSAKLSGTKSNTTGTSTATALTWPATRHGGGEAASARKEGVNATRRGHDAGRSLKDASSLVKAHAKS